MEGLNAIIEQLEQQKAAIERALDALQAVWYCDWGIVVPRFQTRR